MEEKEQHRYLGCSSWMCNFHTPICRSKYTYDPHRPNRRCNVLLESLGWWGKGDSVSKFAMPRME